MDLAACFTRWIVVVETAPTAAASPRHDVPRGADGRPEQRGRDRRGRAGEAPPARPSPAPARVTPRRVSRARSSSRARASRPRVVASLHRSWSGGLLIGHVLEVAEHDRPPVAIGEPVDLLVDHRGRVVAPRAGRDRLAGPLGRAAFLVAAPGGVRLDLERDPPGHAMQPAADGALDPDRPGLARQQEESGLEGVVGVVGVVEDAAADAQDHRPMPTDQGLEGQLVAVGDVPFQEPGVGQARQGPLAEEAVDLPQGGVASQAGHESRPRWFAVTSLY